MSDEKQRISRIREILIGNNISDIEKRFVALESQFEKERIQLEVSVKSSIEDLQQAVGKQVDQNAASIVEANILMDKKIDTLRNELSQLKDNIQLVNEKTKHEMAEVVELMHENKKLLEEKLNQSTEQLKALLLNKLNDIQSTKLDRNTIALLFSELAFELSEGKLDRNNEDKPDEKLD